MRKNPRRASFNAPPLPASLANALGDEIRRRRKAKGFTLAALAAEAGLSHSAVDHYEAGRHPPTLGTLWRLCRALDVPVAELLAVLDGKAAAA